MSDDDKTPESHPLPLTRKWDEDYKRWIAEGCPTPEEEAARKAGAAQTGPPDLQALIERAGRRYCASIGEEYLEDPFRRGREAPHQGGYQHITAAEWAEYDRAMAARRTTKAPGKTESGAVERGPFPDIERMYAAQGGRLPCEEPPLIVKDGKYVPYRSDE